MVEAPIVELPGVFQAFQAVPKLVYSDENNVFPSSLDGIHAAT